MRTSFLLSLLSIFLALPLVWAKSSDYGQNRIKKMSWDGVEVVWLQDERFPTYTMRIYFADGALRDGRNTGLTHAMFELLPAGTRRFNQRQIADNLEYFDVSHWGSVTHEQSSYVISGTTKNIVPTIKKICHLFKDATFPAKGLANYKKQMRSDRKNMVNSHRSLANWVSQEILMKGSPYRYPVEGKIKDFKRMTRKRLKKNLAHFNNKVQKRIYLHGSQKVLAIQNIILEECGWNSKANFVRKDPNFKKSFPASGPNIHLVTVPSANQAQIRMGRYLNKSEIKHIERHRLMNNILGGGGFTSLLKKELRVQRGWVYSVSSYSEAMRDYGLVNIATSTKNENVLPLLKVVKESLQEVMEGKFHHQQFEIMKNSLIYKHPFQFESGKYYLKRLMVMDHQRKDYSDLYHFPRRIRKLTLKNVEQFTRKIYAWDKQTIMILGPAKLKKSLKKLGPVKVTSYKKYL